MFLRHAWLNIFVELHQITIGKDLTPNSGVVHIKARDAQLEIELYELAKVHDTGKCVSHPLLSTKALNSLMTLSVFVLVISLPPDSLNLERCLFVS